MPGSYFIGRAQSVGAPFFPSVAIARFDGDLLIERLEVQSTTPNNGLRLSLTPERQGSWGLLFDWDTPASTTPIGTAFSGGPRGQCAVSFGSTLLPPLSLPMDLGPYLITDTPFVLAMGQIFVLQTSLSPGQVQCFARVRDV
jgi:hypothetical protein